MNSLRTITLPRDQIAQFMPTPRAVKAFEALQQDTTAHFGVLTTGQFLTLDAEPDLGSERVFTPVAGELIGTDGGNNNPYTLGLASTAVTAAAYGDASHTIGLTVDAKGRLTAVSAYALNTDNIAEGTNLYYTDARARSALSGASGISYNSGTGAITAASAGTYGAPTGTLSRTTFASYTAGTTLTFSVIYVQAELTALATRLASVEAALQTVSRTLAALVTDMRANSNLS